MTHHSIPHGMERPSVPLSWPNSICWSNGSPHCGDGYRRILARSARPISSRSNDQPASSSAWAIQSSRCSACESSTRSPCSTSERAPAASCLPCCRSYRARQAPASICRGRRRRSPGYGPGWWNPAGKAERSTA